MPDRDPPVPPASSVKVEDAEPSAGAAVRQTRSRAVTPAATPTQRAKKAVVPPLPVAPRLVAQEPEPIPADNASDAVVERLVTVKAEESTMSTPAIDATIPRRETVPDQEVAQLAGAAGAAQAPSNAVALLASPAGPAVQEVETLRSQEGIAAPARSGKPLVRFTFKAGAITPPPPVGTP